MKQLTIDKALDYINESYNYYGLVNHNVALDHRDDLIGIQQFNKMRDDINQDRNESRKYLTKDELDLFMEHFDKKIQAQYENMTIQVPHIQNHPAGPYTPIGIITMTAGGLPTPMTRIKHHQEKILDELQKYVDFYHEVKKL